MRYHEIMIEASNFKIGLTDIRRLVSRTQLLSLLRRYPVLRGWVDVDGVTWIWNAYELDHNSASYEIPSVDIAIIFWSRTAGEVELAKAEVEVASMEDDREDHGDFFFKAACMSSDCYMQARRQSPVLRKILS